MCLCIFVSVAPQWLIHAWVCVSKDSMPISVTSLTHQGAWVNPSIFVLFGCKVGFTVNMAKVKWLLWGYICLVSPPTQQEHTHYGVSGWKSGFGTWLPPPPFFFQERSVARLWFYCSFAEATGADYYWVITRQDDEGWILMWIHHQWEGGGGNERWRTRGGDGNKVCHELTRTQAHSFMQT